MPQHQAQVTHPTYTLRTPGLRSWQRSCCDGRRGSMSAPGAAPGARQFVSLWELPAARFEGASVAALHGGGYRAVQAEAAQPAGCVAERSEQLT